MPNVSPPVDGGYQYYQKNISELEDELKAQNDRAKKNSEERANEAERGYRRDVQRKEIEFNRAGNELRERAARSNAESKEHARNEIARVKEQTYNRNGKFQNQERRDLKLELAARGQEFENLQKKNQADLNDLRAYQEQKTGDLSRKQQSEMTRAISGVREGAKEAISEDAERNKLILADAREQSAKNQSRLEYQKRAELSDDRRQYHDALAQTTDQFETRNQSNDEAQFARHEDFLRSAQKREEQNTRALNDSHARELKDYQELVKEQAVQGGGYQKGRAEGYADSTREYENEWRAQLKHQGNSYSDEVDAWKDKVRAVEEYKSSNNTEALREKDRFYTGIIRQKDYDAHADQTYTQKSFQAYQTQLEQRNRADRAMHEQNTMNRAAEQNQRTQDLLVEQAANYQESMGRQKGMDQMQIESLSSELQRKSSSTKASDISPGAEEAIRRTYLSETEKARKADDDRAKESVDSVQRDYSKRLHETVLDKEFGLAKRDSEHTLERDRDRRDFVNFAQETEVVHGTSQRRLREENDRQSDNLTKSYAGMLDKQRREGELSSLAQKSEADSRLADLRQRTDFDRKMAQRSFADQQNEITRAYDRKLSDQEVEHTRKSEELRDQTVKQLRESDINARRALEEQARSYDQRIAGMEMQHKERERIITQNYEDQLDKVKRKNALLISKKG